MQSETHEVFVSYSWDSDAHVQRVLSLTQGLRAAGVDAWVDKYETPSEPWPHWCFHQLEGARHVLVVCTRTYRDRVMRKETSGVGRGATWEGAIITNAMYDETYGQDKFIPVVLSADDLPYVPYFLKGYSVYDADDRSSLTDLYARLTGQQTIVPEPVGRRLTLDRRKLETALPVAASATATATPAAPSRPLEQLIQGLWLADVEAPMFGTTVTMRVRMARSFLGKRQFNAVGVVGPPGWTGTGVWQVLPPGNRVALQGMQRAMAPFPQVGPLQEAYTFSSVSDDLLEGVNVAGHAVTWRRE